MMNFYLICDITSTSLVLHTQNYSCLTSFTVNQMKIWKIKMSIVVPFGFILFYWNDLSYLFPREGPCQKREHLCC